jgi:hypothetical protein
MIEMAKEAVSYRSLIDRDGMMHFTGIGGPETLCGESILVMSPYNKTRHHFENMCPFCRTQYFQREKIEVSEKSGG